MKTSIILLFIIICPSIVTAQIQLDITELIISKLEKGSNQRTITNGKDTSIVTVVTTGEWDSPYISTEMRMKNISDSILTLYPNESKLYITFRYNNELIRNNMWFQYKPNDNKIYYPEKIILNPGQEINMISGGYLVESSSSLKLALEFDKQEDNTMNVMRILPTLKYHYKDGNGIEVTHDNVFDVIIEERSSFSDITLPSGYYIVE